MPSVGIQSCIIDISSSIRSQLNTNFSDFVFFLLFFFQLVELNVFATKYLKENKVLNSNFINGWREKLEKALRDEGGEGGR